MNLKKALDSFYYSTALCNLRLMNEKFVDEHITYNSLLYLELIFTMKGECTVSRIADLLIKQGLVTKTPDPDDRRKNYLTVNEEAVPQYKIYRYQDNEAVRRITEKYSGEEIRMFCDMLDMISEINFEELKGE